MHNSKVKYIAAIAIVVAALCVSWLLLGYTSNKAETHNTSLRGKANKETFILGEPVSVEFELLNNGNASVPIFSGGVEVGSLKILIAGRDGQYKEYFAFGWGRLQGNEITLEPKQSYKYKQATILWNGKPRVSHLNEDAAKRALEGKISTEYALPEPGVYFIKGLSYAGENATAIESEPIQVVVNKPAGSDSEVWNQIKGNREIALLMQTGEFYTDKDEEIKALTQTVQEIVQTYPNSSYSETLSHGLEKIRASEQRRKAIRQTMDAVKRQRKNEDDK